MESMSSAIIGAGAACHLLEATGETRHLARAVIDASGTWDRPNPAGASSVCALGERLPETGVCHVPGLSDERATAPASPAACCE